VVARALGAWLALAEDADPALAEGNARAAHSRAPRWRGEPELFARLVARPVAWFESERVNLLAGIGQASQAGLAELAWDLAVSSASYFQMVGYQDWREVHELADAAARAAGDTRGRAALLLANGWVRSARTRPAELVPVFARAKELFQRVGDLPGVAAALLGEGSCLRLTGRLEQALACFERARTLAAQGGAPDQEAAAVVGIAMVHRELGHPERAQERLERVLPVWRDRGARRWEGETVQLLGLALRDRGDLTAALAHFERALALAAELDDRQQQLVLLIDQAELRARLGDRDAARGGLEDALRRAEDLELLYHQARALHALGDLHAAEGKLDEAVGRFTESVRLWRRVGIPRWLAATLVRLGSVQEKAGDPAAAADARTEADRVLATMETSAADAVGRLHRLSDA
jgi:tetratricopeptide (TPR) repeat protein